MKGVIIFLSGVAVGALGIAIWTMKKLVPDLREEAVREAQESAHEFPDYSMYLTDEDTEDMEDSEKEEESDENGNPAPIPSEVRSEVKKTIHENREAPQVDYSQYSDKKKTERKNEKKAPAESASEKEEPFVITPSEFDIREGYLAKAYSIYHNNIIVDDDSDETVDINPLDVFGKTAMEELKKEGIVYIQDDTNKRYYRVEEMECDYEGPDPEDEDDYWRR